MHWVVRGRRGDSTGTLEVDGRLYEVILGRAGVVPGSEKREGDGATPAGLWRVVEGFYRADRVARPVCEAGQMIWRPLTKEDGWCDAPQDARYNQWVPTGYPASHEDMMRADCAYDYILVLNHNGAGGSGPVVAGAGSAIFVHIWRPGATHTAGCVALHPDDFEMLADAVCLGGVVEVIRRD